MQRVPSKVKKFKKKMFTKTRKVFNSRRSKKTRMILLKGENRLVESIRHPIDRNPIKIKAK